jgi:hypothetical protein
MASHAGRQHSELQWGQISRGWNYLKIEYINGLWYLWYWNFGLCVILFLSYLLHSLFFPAKIFILVLFCFCHYSFQLFSVILVFFGILLSLIQSLIFATISSPRRPTYWCWGSSCWIWEVYDSNLGPEADCYDVSVILFNCVRQLLGYYLKTGAAPTWGGGGSRQKLPGPSCLERSPGPEYVAYVLISSRFTLAGGPEKIVSPGPEPALGGPEQGSTNFPKI